MKSLLGEFWLPARGVLKSAFFPDEMPGKAAYL